jgi:hypothetical protein
MTDHNARQAGLTEIREAISVLVSEARSLAYVLAKGYETDKAERRFNEAQARVDTILAAHSADARNGEGVASSKIRRFDKDMDGSMDEFEDGRWVRYEDVAALLAAPAPTEAEIEAQDKSIADAATMKLMFINVMAAFATGRNLEAQLQATYDWCERSGMVKKYSTMERAAAPAPAAQADERVALGKWSEECKNWGHPATPEARAAFIDGYRARQQSATPPECTCPSGNGSLRHPCPVHPKESK